MNLEDLMSKKTKKGEPKQRYTDYVIETQEKGEEALTFPEWYKLNQ